MSRGKLLSTLLAAIILVLCGFFALRIHASPPAKADGDDKPAASKSADEKDAKGDKDDEKKSAKADKDDDEKKGAKDEKDAKDEKGGDEKKGADDEALEVEAAPVHEGTLAETLSVTGVLKPLPNGQSRVAAQLAGRVQAVLVKPGQAVHRGDLLVTVSRPELQSATLQADAAVRESERELDALRSERATKAAGIPLLERKAQADLSAAQARLALLKAGSRAEEIERAEANLQSAQADLDRLKAGARPQEIAQAQAAVREALSERDTRRKEFDRKQALLEKGIVAQKDVERARADADSAQVMVETRQEALALLKAGNRPEEIRAAEGKVREAQAALRQTRSGSRPEEIREGEATVAAAQTGMDQARAARQELGALDARLRGASARVDAARQAAQAARVGQGRVQTRSPIDGVVTQVLVNPGDGVTEQSAVAEILNRDAFRAILDIPAGKRLEVRPGVRAEITIPGVPGAQFSGAVRDLIAQASAETGLIPAEVWVTDPKHRLADGMPVNARLLLRNTDHRLFVPASAIFAREGTHYVYKIADGKVHETEVESGADQNGETEILKGLKAGDRVVRSGSRTLPNGTKVKVAP